VTTSQFFAVYVGILQFVYRFLCVRLVGISAKRLHSTERMKSYFPPSTGSSMDSFRAFAVSVVEVSRHVSQVARAVIQWVVVQVVNHESGRCLHNESMEMNVFAGQVHIDISKSIGSPFVGIKDALMNVVNKACAGCTAWSWNEF
jgi:hypothetical protein